MTVAESPLPSVDSVLREARFAPLIGRYGRAAVLDAVRRHLAEARLRYREGGAGFDPDALFSCCVNDLARPPSLRPVHNLTGTVLHTNLGRALLPASAVEAAAAAMTQAVNLEFDLEAGGRGERDEHVAALLCRLTGAAAATAVNNNAAAVLLVLNTFAARKEVLVSRGELIEIGGAFRLPDIMARAGCRLREVGTTNRTHERDFAEALGPRSGLVMKVHTSNYVVQGFTKAVPAAALARLAAGHGIPFVEDLGSGTLVPLEAHGLPHEPTAAEALAAGADLVTFSGDKLLGGPQAGLIVGSKALIDRVNRNPLKRALRLDKIRLAALEAVLRLYADPARLADELPTLRLLRRPAAAIADQARRLLPVLAARLDGRATVTAEACRSQIGSGALPLETLDSACLRIVPAGGRKGAGARLEQLAAAFRALPVPVIGRVRDGALFLDLRCLADEAGFVAQLDRLAP